MQHVIVVVAWCLIGVAACIGLVVDSLLPGGPHLPEYAWIVAFVGAFPPAFAVVGAIRGRPFGRISWREGFALLRPLPRVVKAGLVLVYAAAILNLGYVAVAGMPADARATRAGYTVHSHGAVRSLSREEYLHDRALLQRRYSVHLAALYAGEGALAAGLLIRRRRTGAYSDRSPLPGAPAASRPIGGAQSVRRPNWRSKKRR